MELLIIILLVLLNGVFAMSEMSLVSSRKFKLENAARKGSMSAKKAVELSENPTKFLSTVQIGITLIGILLGVYSGENLTNDFKNFLDQFAVIQPYSKPLATIGIVIFITYLSILLGELLPKRIAMTFPERIITLLAKPMDILSKVTSPFVLLLTTSNNLLLKLLGIKNKSDSIITEDEIKSMVRESAQEGQIEQIEHNIVERVFELGDRKINTLLTHRTAITFFNINEGLDNILKKIKSEKHNAYPITSGNNLDDIIGIVMLKDIFPIDDPLNFDLKKHLRQPIFLNENYYAYKVLEIFKKEKNHYGIVIDEYGNTVGIITMHDVLDALVGNTATNENFDYRITQRSENTWLADAQFPIVEFIKYFDLDYEFENKDNYTTLVGFFLNAHNGSTEVGDKITIENLELEIIDKDRQRVDKILISRH
ncbi:HlyC/CorC family transporter [Kaistella flava (ex Peng et al. 2021)]|uniref:HlyC/CorC family transporter n=1 Tax=Kaistella flava (ex Peng et al. 2021) TaxID=2038776 RepID=A0A7M2Y7H3_9FLAO|nr:hemolysin family protein [Kaistella flava (ex Peng et al. 2021)]QOW10040.1 HlyC/CorC family transporter [Kaistella flava (ex Peng et al. 2021)]